MTGPCVNNKRSNKVNNLENKKMMDYGYMMGNYGGGMMFFAWIPYILLIVLLVLGIAALWKYIGKK